MQWNKLNEKIKSPTGRIKQLICIVPTEVESVIKPVNFKSYSLFYKSISAVYILVVVVF